MGSPWTGGQCFVHHFDSNTFWQLVAKYLVAEKFICSNAPNCNALQAQTCNMFSSVQ